MNTNDTVEDVVTSNKTSLKKYTFPRVRSWLHIGQVICTLLAICLVAPVIALQVRYKGTSGPAANYTLFVALFTFVIPLCLVFFPWLYESRNKMKRCGKFFLKPRTNLIFTGFYSLLWLTAAAAMTSYALNVDTCTLDSNQKQEGYSSAWMAQCYCAKIDAVLCWLTCVLWVITLIMAVIVFWKQKQLVQKNLKQMAMNKETVELDTEIIEPSQQNPASAHMPPADPHQSTVTGIIPGTTPAVSEPYCQPSFNHQQQHYHSSTSSPPAFSQQQGSLSSVAMYPNYQSHHQQPPYHTNTVVTPPPQQQTLLPLATMPDPQNYRQQRHQHGVV